MKKMLFLLFVLSSSLNLHAQDNYRPLVEEGKTFNYIVDDVHYEFDKENNRMIRHDKYLPSSLVIKGDTVVDGIEYKKIMHESESVTYYNEDENPNFLYGIIREENKKVYIRYFVEGFFFYENKEFLIYDFGLNVGDCFVEDFNGLFTTTLKLESIEVKDGKRIFNFSTNNNQSPTRQWMEGAGGRYALGLEEIWDIPTCIECDWLYPQYQSCYIGDDCLCTFDENGNVVLGVEVIKTIDGKDDSIYDLQGRRLNAEPERGLYIKDGKKIAR